MTGVLRRGRRGNTIVPNWRFEDHSLDSYDLHVAGWIASHVDQYLADYVTRNEIARRTGISTPRVSKSLDALVAAGVISIEPLAGKGSRFVITFDVEVWETAPANRERSYHQPEAPLPPTGSDAPTSVIQRDDQETLTLSPPTLSAGQVADRIMRDYWKWVESKTGRKPIAMKPLGFKSIITPFLEAGIEGPPIKKAVAAIYERGETLTKAGLERELDGRGHRRRSKTALASRVLQFDDHGNLLP